MEILVQDEEVIRLETLLPPLQEEAHLLLLTTLAWHLRQRDTRRALALAREVQALSANAGLTEPEWQALAMRLALVEGEAQWLFAELDDAEAIAHRALETALGLQDAAGCADAHWLLACIMVDRGDPVRRDAELEQSAAEACRAGDGLRENLAEAALARWAVFRDLPAAQERWSDRFSAGLQRMNPCLAVWVHDFLGMIAFQTSDFGKAIEHRLQMHEAALATGQIRCAIIAATNIGACFGNLNDHQTALEWMQRSLDMARDAGWPAAIGNGLVQTAEMLRYLGRFEASREMLLEARANPCVSAGTRTYAMALEYDGNLALDREDYSAALDSFRQLEQNAIAVGQGDMHCSAQRGQAHALSHMAQPEAALAAAQASLALAHAQKNVYNQIDALMVLADIHARHALPGPAGMTAVSAALHYLLQARQLGAEIEGYTTPGKLLDAIAREYAKAGQHAQAYAASLQAIAARDKTNSAEAVNRAIAVQILHQTERTRAESEHHQQLAAAEARRAEALQQTGATLERLSAIGQEITAHLDVAALFQTLNRHVHGLLDATHFSIFLLDAQGRGLDCAFGVEQGQPLPALQVGLSSSISNIARCARERQEIVREQLSEGDNHNLIPGTLPSPSAIYSPLSIGERLLGVMTVQSPREHAYGERERLIFRTLCAYGAIALDNAATYRKLEATLKTLRETQSQLVEKNRELEQAYREQEQASLTDPLTGLRNRRFLLQNVDTDIALTLRRNNKRPKPGGDRLAADTDMAFLLIDLDHFKLVNDQHGHAAGDAVLVQMRERLQKATRETDYIIRWGGEEFLVVARATDRNEVSAIAERIRLAVADQPFEIMPGVLIDKTCSIGFACFPFLTAHPRQLTWLQVVELADHALYMAKQGGRNAWVGWYGSADTLCGDAFQRLTRDTVQAIRDGALQMVSSRALGT